MMMMERRSAVFLTRSHRVGRRPRSSSSGADGFAIMSWLFLLLYLCFVGAQADSADSQQQQRDYFPLPPQTQQQQHFRPLPKSHNVVASQAQAQPELAPARKRVRIRPVSSRRPSVNASAPASESVSVSLGSASFSEQLSFSVKRGSNASASAAHSVASSGSAPLEEEGAWLSAQRRDKRVQVVRATLRPSAGTGAGFGFGAGKREGPLRAPQPLTNVTPTLSPQISTASTVTSEDTEVSTTSASPPTMQLHETVTEHKATAPLVPFDFTLAPTVGTTATTTTQSTTLATTSPPTPTTTFTTTSSSTSTSTAPATTTTTSAEPTSASTERLTTTASPSPAPTFIQPESDDGFNDFASEINVTDESDPFAALDADYQQDAKHQDEGESAFAQPKHEPFIQFHREIRHVEGSSIMITVTPRKFTDQTSVEFDVAQFAEEPSSAEYLRATSLDSGRSAVTVVPLSERGHQKVVLDLAIPGWYLVCGQSVRYKTVLERGCFKARVSPPQEQYDAGYNATSFTIMSVVGTVIGVLLLGLAYGVYAKVRRDKRKRFDRELSERVQRCARKEQEHETQAYGAFDQIYFDPDEPYQERCIM